MPGEGRRGGLGFPNSQFVDGLDEVAKGLAGDTISRRRALKMTGAALLGAALVPFSSAPAEAVAEAGRCSDRRAINNRRCSEGAICHSSATQICACAKTVSGKRRCVDVTLLVTDRAAFCAADQCERNRDCPAGEICVRAGACCNVPELQVCVRPCVIT